MNEIQRHWCLLMTLILKCTKHSGHVSDRPLPLIPSLTQMVDYQQTVFQLRVVLTFIACRLNLRQAAHIKSAINRNRFFPHLFDNRVNLLWRDRDWWHQHRHAGIPPALFFLKINITYPAANSHSKPLHLDLLRLRQSTCAKWNRSLSHVSRR